MVDEKRIKYRHYDCLTNEFTYEYFTDEELIEIEKIEEQNKNKKPIIVERIEKLEDGTTLLDETVVDVDFRLTMLELGLN